MCGIVAVLERPSDRPVPASADLLAAIDRALTALGDDTGLGRASDEIEAVDAALRGAPGVQALLADGTLTHGIEERLAAASSQVADLEARLDAGSVAGDGAAIEALNAAVVRLKDALWAVGRDRLAHARAVGGLAGAVDGPTALRAYGAIQTALSSIDRLEVRGRDSAGLHVLVTDHGLDLGAPDIAALIDARADALFTARSVRTAGGALSFVYKAAAEIGELGDNVAALRAQIAGDELLRRAVSAPAVRTTVLGHTRWASVGIISEANAHPLNQEEPRRAAGPYVVAALNGDVDNYVELREAEGMEFPPEVTTDAKVIPALVSRRAAEGHALDDAFRSTVARFDGSVAIAASAAEDPDRLLLALRGSGQALYVGLADDAFVVASEPYGLVEETARYVRMDGESAGPSGIAGQVLVLDRAGAGTLDGVRRLGYDGTALPIDPGEIVTAEITTRDIDRAGFPHFLLKELTEAPQSFRKTLRGKIADGADGRPAVALTEENLPAPLRARLADGGLRRVIAIGQGTSGIAAQSLAAALAGAVEDRITASAMPATELSGFGLVDDMSDTLVVAISQSGTTTDTNRTVDLARARGASVVAIVNRRNSDIVERADGVIYTSDGRDVEMAVPSTKAFYGQIAAGLLLAHAIAAEVIPGGSAGAGEIVAGLRRLPDAMDAVLADRPAIAEAAHRLCPSRRYWAIIGNGPNRIAAQEIRIKLSELCYKSISYDVTEDKKHIDLSCEPMIIVCAAGLSGANADDVAKEVAIFRAHKAAPVVIASDGDERFGGALAVLTVPAVHPSLDFVLSAMVGHLFGYEAALAIDAQARDLRAARGVIEEALGQSGSDSDAVLVELSSSLEPAATQFFTTLRSGAYNGHLDADVAVHLASLFRYATGLVPLDAFEMEYGKLASPAVVIEELTGALTTAIEQLTRPIDAIKHQAKTVTVGISRSEDALLDVPLVKAVLGSGAGRDRIGYRALRTLAGLDPAVAEVVGYTRYRIEGSVAGGDATIHVVDRGGVSRDIVSRTESDARLLGTKHRAVEEREVTVAKGRRDGRSLVLVPEAKDNQATGLTLLQVEFREQLDTEEMAGVLRGYRGRYNALADAVTETESSFDESLLSAVPVIDLLTEPVYVLAERWRG
ncbi:MAG TPA: SIS domain-containing protein [Acidimicrobiales bacterium]|nr:SIS domain-containing protein [Acidimicrobiales bacterium]